LVGTCDDAVIDGHNELEVLPWSDLLGWLFQVKPVFFVGRYGNAAFLASRPWRRTAGAGGNASQVATSE
jgi:hypothetical protein